MIKSWREKLHQGKETIKRSENVKNLSKFSLKYLEKGNPKEDSNKTTISISKVLSKILNRNKTSKKQYHFCKDMISLEVHDM